MSSRYYRLVPGRIALGLLRSFAGTSWTAEAHCQANRGINAVGFSKLTKYCDSFRFLKLFCVHFCREGTHVSKEDPINAKKSLNDYKTLRVRVSGFSDYFVLLNEDLQDDIIKRTEHVK